MVYSILRNGTGFLDVKPEGKKNRKIMDVNIVDMVFTLNYYIFIGIGDQIVVGGETYTIKNEPEIKEVSPVEWAYTLQFKGKAYDLVDYAMLGLDANNNLTEADFVVMGNADVIIDLVIQNANRVDAGWTKGIVDVTIAQNFPFTGSDNCLSTLARLAEAYSIEWWVDNQTIHLTKKGDIQPTTFEVGRGKGLYDITRSASDKQLFTRLIAYGSTDNLAGDYRGFSKHLKLPAPLIYLENNVYINNDPAQGKKYGIIEHVEYFDNIRPEYVGTVTTFIDKFNFIDTGINFNVGLQQLPNQKPRISVLTGQLAGYEFEIGGYDHGTKTVKILKSDSEKAIEIPSDLLHLAVGDTYAFVNLIMPQSYIDAAETRLQIEAQNFLDKYSEPYVIYNCTPSLIRNKIENISVNLGDYVHLTSNEFGVNGNIRITSITEDLQEPKDFSFDLQDIMSIPQIVRNYVKYAALTTAVNINKLSDINRMRMNWQTSQQLRSKIYDPDGNYFDTGNIRPSSIETLMLSVGAKSQQFVLEGVRIEANYNGDASQFAYSAGNLIHFTLFSTPYTWVIAPGLITGLTAGQFYYIYAKCSKLTNDATIILNDVPIATEEITDYYVFLVGALHSEISGVRGISLTYGQTTINGRFITTGLIQSADGKTFFDLDLGVIGGAIQFGTNGGSTVIDGKLVTTSTLILGDPGTGDEWAGITGDVDYTGPIPDPDPVLIWAGASFDDRDTAPFRVMLDGSVVMTNAKISGEIEATIGKIGNFTIDQYGLKNTANLDAYIDQTRTFPGADGIKRVAIGTSVDNVSTLGYLIMVQNNYNPSGYSSPNAGLYVSVKNGHRGPLQAAFSGNTAAYLEGDLVLSNGNFVVMTDPSTFQKGITDTFTYDRDGDVGRITIFNGIIIKKETNI